jgi:hypothetical protein
MFKYQTLLVTDDNQCNVGMTNTKIKPLPMNLSSASLQLVDRPNG